MFVRIKGEDMVPGNKYKIDGFTGYLIEWYVFERLNLRNYKGQTIHCLSKDYIFYEFVPQNPQWNDDLSIGDDCFEW
jgi:hypothetical protein